MRVPSFPLLHLGTRTHDTAAGLMGTAAAIEGLMLASAKGWTEPTTTRDMQAGKTAVSA